MHKNADDQCVHVIHHFDEHVQKLMYQFLNIFEHKLEKIMATLDDVVNKVTDLGSVEDGVVTLLTDVKTKLDAAIASGDPAKIQQISDALGAQKQKLADAITANTPAA